MLTWENAIAYSRVFTLSVRFSLLSGAVKQKNSGSDSSEAFQAYSSVIKIGFMRLPKHPCLSLTFLAGNMPSCVETLYEIIVGNKCSCKVLQECKNTFTERMQLNKIPGNSKFLSVENTC